MPAAAAAARSSALSPWQPGSGLIAFMRWSPPPVQTLS
jgi:hypothetical protein